MYKRAVFAAWLANKMTHLSRVWSYAIPVYWKPAGGFGRSTICRRVSGVGRPLLVGGRASEHGERQLLYPADGRRI